MKDNKFIKTHKIKTYQDLINLILGKSEFGDLRQDYIFRGLKKSYYELIPSSLRKDENGIYEITKFLADSEFKLGLQTNFRQAVEDDFYGEKFEVTKENENGIVMRPINKHGRIIEGNYRTPYIKSASELQFKRETYVLLKFLNYCDRIGLRIQVNEKVRRWLHNFTRYQYEQETIWPEFEFFEIISLAQHYGLPTRALDWSYDYKIALYFAVEDALKKDNEDCVLWAFNYKLFEDKYGVSKYFYEIPKLEIYRPEYNSNPNLNAQKGLFTFWSLTSDDNLLDDTAFDELVINELKENTRINEYDPTKTKYHKIEGYEGFIIPENIKIFHKFIIPSELKIKILEELYAEGYTNEFIYPSYRGVVDSIRKKVELDEYIKKLNVPPKINMIMSFDENEIENIFENEKRMIFKQKLYHSFLDNIFIYSKDSGKILGYFKGDEIIKNTPENMWYTFHEKSILSEEEFFKYFENRNEGYGIKINNLTKLDYPIKISLNMESEFYYIHPNDKNLNYLLNFIK